MLHAQGFENVKLWPRGADMALFNPSRRSPKLRNEWLFSAEKGDEEKPRREKVVLAYVGRISHEKNIGLLISAFTGLEAAVQALDPDHPGCKLILVGDGPARASLQAECANLDISFLGYRKGEELAACYASSDIFAFPSHSETFGNVVLEALASGLPVVGLKAEGVCDLVQDGRTGYLLDLMLLPGAVTEGKGGAGLPNNPAQLLDRKGEAFEIAVKQYRQLLLSLVIDAPLRAQMAQAAVEYAKTRTWKEAMGCLIAGKLNVLKERVACSASCVFLPGYREAAAITQQRRSTNLMRTLSRTSSTASLMDVRIEEPPLAEIEQEDVSSGSSTSTRLLFGRPPLKSLLRRSGRAAIRESMHLKWKVTARAYELDTSVATKPAGLSRLQLVAGKSMSCYTAQSTVLTSFASVILLFALVGTVVRYFQANMVV